MRTPHPWRAYALSVALAVQCAGCGGGGGGGGAGTGTGSGGSSAVFSVNTNTITLTAANPAAAPPQVQKIQGTVAGSLSGALHVDYSVTGTAVSTVADLSASGNSGDVVPTPAILLGAGTFTSTITVSACAGTCANGQLAGSPQTIAVTYTIGSSSPPDAVVPHVVTAGIAGQVVIRGTGLSGVTNVSFGGNAATAVTAVSATEVHASYGALPAGTAAVTLNGGATTFSGSIDVLAPQTYAQQTLTFPQTPQQINATLYDPERSAFYVAATLSQNAGTLWCYTYSAGARSSQPAAISIPGLQAISLSNDGTRLLVLTNTSMVELDPANPGGTPLATITAPNDSTGNVPPSFSGMAMANDGNALIANTEGAGDAYMFSVSAGAFVDLASSTADSPLVFLDAGSGNGPPILASSADGSTVLVAQPAPTSDYVLQYDPSVTMLKQTNLISGQLAFQPPAMDANADQRVFFNGSEVYICNASYSCGGYYIGSTRALVVNRQGTRLYTLNTDNTFHTFDLTNGSVSEIGSGTTLTVPASSGTVTVHMEIAPDGGTVFLTGDTGVLIIPVS